MKKHQNTYTFTALFVIALILISCNKRAALTDIPLDTDSPLISKAEKIEGGNLSSIVDSMRLIPLDESQFIGRIKRIRYANGNLYIIADDKLLLFNDNGDFIKVVAIKGQGPEEFLYFCDFDVDSTGIVIRDNTKFMFFDVMGNPIRQISHKYGFGCIRLLPGGGWVITMVAPLKNNKRMVVFDNVGDTIATALDDYEFDHGHYQDLFHVNNDVVMHPMYYHGGNELFVLNTRTKESKFIPVSTSGDPMSCKEMAAYVKTPNELTDVPKMTYLGYSDNRSMLFFSALMQGEKYRHLLDKETGKVLVYRDDQVYDDLTAESGSKGMLTTTYYTTSDNDYFVTWLENPKATYEQQEKLNPRFKQEYAKLSDMDEESNPVVALIKFKSPVTLGNENQ